VIYAATKGALDVVTRVLARELAPRGIRVNTLSPGAVVTEGSRRVGFVGSDQQKQIVAETPLGRIGQPEDIAGAALLLASPDAAWITGERLAAAGGLR
jgi:3-oxoacyl-[acyl-carrier protein] reductase